ncbi:Trk system potassium transporter TrkA [Thiorhodococcus minor]|nr:Trk system potassium transporter TrkA [Thiorhodococcus minor]
MPRGSDQTNLCACRIAATLFNVPTKIARLRSGDYRRHPELLDSSNFCVDFDICPEQIITDYLIKLIEFPEALQVLEFAEGLVSLVAVRAVEGGPMVGRPVAELRTHIPRIDARIAAIYRKDQPITPAGDTRIRAGDEIFYLAAKRDIRQVLDELHRRDRPTRRIMIAGGGNIGSRFAAAAQGRYQVKVVERDEARAEALGATLTGSLVLLGDATDETLLNAENIEDMDVFMALTNDDENNIMAALLAKRLGARRVLALINRRAYADLLQADRLDIAISPAQISIGTLLARVRRGDVAAVHSLRRGAAEALEFVVHGDSSTSKVIGRRIAELNLPRGVSIGAIVRAASQDSLARGDRRVLMAHDDILIEPEDHVILFLARKDLVHQVERYFQVGLAYF